MLNILLHYPFNWLISVGARDSVGDSNSVGASDSDKPFGTQFAVRDSDVGVFSEAQELRKCWCNAMVTCAAGVHSTVQFYLWYLLYWRNSDDIHT